MDYRLGSMDWIPELGRVNNLERVAVVGAGRDANTKAVARIRSIIPTATVDGMPGEDWDHALETAVVDWLGDFRPQLVLLGLGMPLQESVLNRRLHQLPPPCTARWAGRLNRWRVFKSSRRAGWAAWGSSGRGGSSCIPDGWPTAYLSNRGSWQASCCAAASNRPRAKGSNV